MKRMAAPSLSASSISPNSSTKVLDVSARKLHALVGFGGSKDAVDDVHLDIFPLFHPSSLLTPSKNVVWLDIETRRRQMTTRYELGARHSFPTLTGGIVWKDTKSIEGVLAWARDERTGEYVRVYETGPTEWVDGEPQAWSTGNFESIEDAKKWASTAYRWMNKNRRAAA
jgi:hypothetical protein